MTDKTVATTILSQLGGNRFIAMTGSKQFSCTDNLITFKVGSNPKKVSHVRITLDPSDTYTMEFLKVSMKEIKTLKKITGVYCDMLRDIFTDNTGLYTSL